jgi:hypothetical protein
MSEFVDEGLERLRRGDIGSNRDFFLVEVAVAALAATLVEGLATPIDNPELAT